MSDWWKTQAERAAKPIERPRSFDEWRRGTPQERSDAELEQQRDYDKNYALGTLIARLEGAGRHMDREIVPRGAWTSIDPRELRLEATYDQMQPARPKSTGASRMGDAVYDGLFQTFVRPRDTLITAATEANKPDADGWLTAALLARAPLSVPYPQLAAGTPGSPDDWRERARKLGISPGNVMFLDYATDPETYMAVPAPFKAAGHLVPYAKQAAYAARYGRGIPTSLVDMNGDVIRYLRSSQALGRAALPAP